MKYFMDCEFIEDGRTIDLISLGMVREDGRTLYIEISDCDLSRADPWVVEHVISKLEKQKAQWYVPHAQAKEILLDFLEGDKRPNFWAYFGAYDWVALCQLFGKMINIPKNWRKICMDVKQLTMQYGNPTLPGQTTPEHHALNDAIWTMQSYYWLINPSRGYEFTLTLPRK